MLTYDIMKGRFYDDDINPLERDENAYTVPNSKAMINARLPYNDDDNLDVPF
jgi:hypothetical protein